MAKRGWCSTWDSRATFFYPVVIGFEFTFSTIRYPMKELALLKNISTKINHLPTPSRDKQIFRTLSGRGDSKDIYGSPRLE
jgi:hypothetical protein